MTLKALLTGVALATLASAASAEPYRLGVLTDMSGMNFDLAGQGSVVAARMAVEDFGGTLLGEPVEVIVGDHQNKPDVGATLARRWIDEQNVKAVIDVPTSSVAMAVQDVTRAADVAFLISTAGSSDLTGKACSPSSALWTWDTYALANGTGRAMTQEGGKSWFFITADYTFGHALERDTSEAVRSLGGEVVGAVRHPRETTDFSSYLLQAQASGADVIALANSSGDTMTAMKQAGEYGITAGGQKLAGLLLFLTDVDGVGLETAQGLTLTTGFYWDFDDQTRAWSTRFGEQMGGRMPTMVQAGVYSAVLNYLKAAEAAKTVGGTAVMSELRTMKIDDMFARNAYLREDGRLVHDMYLAQVKTPQESTGRWDYYKILRTIPGEEAFKPLEQSDCPLVKK
ncbi:ABC transporter permease [Haematobacter missouriensis]|uniref:ABC transporter permease n=1 Tax=Haematobacter missouriensis TaxID=366616 RepID=A0A212AN72_9RHOB|nr:ABC transporter substrate-binding protein [Haematobacter missouriensis]KFI25834.1 ABC transporter permease [Haematobacter missouriensis]OWJ74818.1 ABC transporter permease [Haematobacter missouriensis]OWJ82919.1 ABC transporter permease [Haematobacter missouriensis]